MNKPLNHIFSLENNTIASFMDKLNKPIGFTIKASDFLLLTQSFVGKCANNAITTHSRIPVQSADLYIK